MFIMLDHPYRDCNIGSLNALEYYSYYCIDLNEDTCHKWLKNRLTNKQLRRSHAHSPVFSHKVSQVRVRTNFEIIYICIDVTVNKLFANVYYCSFNF